MSVIDKAAWLPVIGRKVPFALTRGQDLFFNIGGKVEPGESLVEALMREVAEEANVWLIPDMIRKRFVLEGPCYGQPDTLLRMHCFDAGYEGSIAPGHEVERIEFFNTANLHQTPDLGQTILWRLKSEGYID